MTPASLISTTGPVGGDDQNQAFVDPQELHGIVSRRRRTDANRFHFGIPAEDDNYHQKLLRPADISNGIASASQANSWDELSRTSYSPDYSIVDAVEKEDVPSATQGFYGSIPPPPTMSSVTQVQVTQNADTPYTQWDSGQSYSAEAPSYPSSQPFRSAEFSNDVDLLTEVIPLSVNPANSNLGINMNTGEQAKYGGSYNTTMPSYSAVDLSPGVQVPRGFSPMRHLLSNLQFSDAVESVPVLEQYVNPAPQEHDTRSDIPSVTRNPKRKRSDQSSTPVRPNLSKINKVRKLRACIRCKVLHEEVCFHCSPIGGQSTNDPGKCDFDDPCQRCRNTHLTGRIWKNQPCVRANLGTVEVHRTTALSFPDGVPKLDFLPKHTKTVSLYNIGFTQMTQPSSSRPQLKVQCQKFHEKPEVCCWKSYLSRGEKKDLKLPPYAMPRGQVTALKNEVDPFLKAHFRKLLTEVAFGQDEIVSMIISEATRQMENSEALQGALEIAVITRLILKSFNIVNSDETLELGLIDDPDSPDYRRIPIPALLDAQLDRVWMEKMTEIRKRTLKQLRNMMTGKKKRENWYKIFLTMLVLLYNIEAIYQHQIFEKASYQKTNPKQERMMESWEHAAHVLIWYFRAVCNGQIPLNMEYKEVRHVAELDFEAQQFLERLRFLLTSRADDLKRRTKCAPGTPLVWISTLFLP